jgi:hypothetical protein
MAPFDTYTAPADTGNGWARDVDDSFFEGLDEM